MIFTVNQKAVNLLQDHVYFGTVVAQDKVWVGVGSGRLSRPPRPAMAMGTWVRSGELLLCGGGSGYRVCDFLLKALVCEHKLLMG